ncbi:MAG TPA: leucyl aminopeptidase family protein [Gammaproteobacteria bacterium]|nr:leucyl aminopeptidase family protein [Gammaproteobacteria bacterium]
MPVTANQLRLWRGTQGGTVNQWIDSHGFDAKPHACCVIPHPEWGIDRVLYGVDEALDTWSIGDAPTQLPAGDYKLICDWDEEQRFQAALGWGMGAYRFDRYKSADAVRARLLVESDMDRLTRELAALWRVRDLINTPPNDMMPPELASEARALADRHGAVFEQIVGDALLTENYPAIHAVGRASVHEPRLLTLRWGETGNPRVTLVGKGVCFDSGGLDLKNAAGMRYMQKDMGGAAHVLGLAELIMTAELPVELRVLIPAVENAVAGNAFHPGDILESRSGTTIEIENTDAEGRLILCDAITEACRNVPDLLIDFATLTGAARVAVGTEIGCYFSNREDLAETLQSAGEQLADPVWRLPLHQPYREQLKSQSADLMNCSSGGFGGAITAALFLQHFVADSTDWIHFDVMAWNQRKRPGRPEGGEAMGIRAAFELIKSRYTSRDQAAPDENPE